MQSALVVYRLCSCDCVCCQRRTGGSVGGKSVVKEKPPEEDEPQASSGELFGEAANFHKPGKTHRRLIIISNTATCVMCTDVHTSLVPRLFPFPLERAWGRG